jgi:hypothetical protein
MHPNFSLFARYPHFLSRISLFPDMCVFLKVYNPMIFLVKQPVA